jgi:hypothetical protein
MNMSIEETIRQIVAEELDKRQTANTLIPVSEFCATHNISRVTLWRQEKAGTLKVHRVGRKTFVNINQFK